jgi:hypothetical protein
MHAVKMPALRCILLLLALFSRGWANTPNTPKSPLQVQRTRILTAVSAATAVTASAALLGVTLTANRENDVDRAMHASLLERIPPHSRVLEVGFGGGANLDFYPRQQGVRVTGIDPLLPPTADARSKRLVQQYVQRGINLDLQQVQYIE